ncbi:MAG TPA: hypothetical protein VEL82_06790 [Thermoplasmata archaeon]|nr:hypothetical protein [Thermoplasmata archaeon]
MGLLLLVTGAAAAAGPVRASEPTTREVATQNASAVANFSAVINRLVELVGAAGSGVLALVWARVALSWFSHDVTKKVQAKERARDAVIGTLLFVGALSGLIWALAHWVLTGA